MVVKRYRKKPVVIEAIQFDGTALSASVLIDWGRGAIGVEDASMAKETLCIETLEGVMHVSAGDYVIKGTSGEFYPCKPDVFAAVYEEV